MPMSDTKEATQQLVFNELPGDLPLVHVVLSNLLIGSDKLILKTKSGEEVKGRFVEYRRDHAVLNFTAKKDDTYFSDINDILVADVIAWAFDGKPNENHNPSNNGN